MMFNIQLALRILIISTYSILLCTAASCTDHSTLTAFHTDNTLSIAFEIDCIESKVTINITHTDYSNTWFGIVFNGEMSGDALVFTTGKGSEAQRPSGLYAYGLSAKSLSGVQYQSSKNWNEISTQEEGSTMMVSYQQEMSKTVISNSAASITFRVAWGQSSDGLELNYHGFGQGTRSPVITVDFANEVTPGPPSPITTLTTSSPSTSSPTSKAPSREVSSGDCKDSGELSATHTLDSLQIKFDIDCESKMVQIDITYTEYSDNWFGVVFSDIMFGEALIFTTGKASETQREAGLYSYKTTSKAFDGSGVVYQESKNWKEHLTEQKGSELRVTYQQDLSDSDFSLDTNSVTLRAAWGHTLTLEYHKKRSQEIITLNLLSGSSSSEKEDLTKEQVHGAFMWVAWGVLAPIGIGMSAFRWLLPESFGWFVLHRSIQITVVVMTFTGFIIALTFTAEKNNEHFHNHHMRLGLVVVIFTLLQPLNALIRPHRPVHGWRAGAKPTSRVVWEVVHKGCGYVLWILAQVTILLGLEEYGEQRLGYIHLFAWAGSIFGVYGVFWLYHAIKEEEASAAQSRRHSNEIEDMHMRREMSEKIPDDS